MFLRVTYNLISLRVYDIYKHLEIFHITGVLHIIEVNCYKFVQNLN
jgi:hypothetical protein